MGLRSCERPFKDAAIMTGIGGEGNKSLNGSGSMHTLDPVTAAQQEAAQRRAAQRRADADEEELKAAVKTILELATHNDPARLLEMHPKVQRIIFGDDIQHAFGRVIGQQEVETALQARSAAQVAGYPDFRLVSSYQQMTDPQAMPEPVVGDAATGIVMRRGHTARLLADGKGGKTAIGLEWCRSSITGEPWLGHFPVVPMHPEAGIAFLDPELDADFPWYMQQAFGGLDKPVVDRVRRVDLVAMKSQGWSWASAMDRDWLVDQVGGCQRMFADSVLSLVPSGAKGEATHSLDAVGEFLDQFKAVQRAAEVSEVLVGIHRPSGGAEKSFGSIQWDAKFQALLSIKVAETTGDRSLRGYRGRAGTGFAEAPVVQQDGKGRVSYVALGVGAAAPAAKVAEVIGKFPGVLASFSEPGPSKTKVLAALRKEVSFSNKLDRDVWDQVKAQGLAVVHDQGGGGTHRVWAVGTEPLLTAHGAVGSK